MARIRLEEALALGLIPPDQVAGLMQRFPAVGRSQMFGSPLFIRPSTGAGALQRNLFGFGPYGGAQTARFGLGPLLQGLGLSPAPSAVTSPGAVPIGAATRRREELTPEQLMALYGQMERAGANPRSIAPQSIAPPPQPAMNRLRVMGVTPEEVRAIKEAAGPAGGDVTQALSVARKAVGVTKDVLDDQSLLRQVVDPILGLEHPTPTRSEPAFQAQREGERNPLTFPGAEVGAFRPFTPNAAQTALEGGSVAPLGFDVATAVPFQPSSDVVSGASGGASAAGAAAELGPEAADALARAVSGGGEAAAASAPVAGSLIGQAGPVVKGLGIAGSLAGLGQNIASGNIKNSILNAASIASAFLPPPLDFILPLAFSASSFFGNNEQAMNQAHEHGSILKAFGTAFPQRIGGANVLENLPPNPTIEDLIQASDRAQIGLGGGSAISQFISTGGGREKNIPGVDISFYNRPVSVGSTSLPLGTVLNAKNIVAAIRLQDALARRRAPLGSPQYQRDQPLNYQQLFDSIGALGGVSREQAPWGFPGSEVPNDDFTVPSVGSRKALEGLTPGSIEESMIRLFEQANPNFRSSPLAAILKGMPTIGSLSESTIPAGTLNDTPPGGWSQFFPPAGSPTPTGMPTSPRVLNDTPPGGWGQFFPPSGSLTGDRSTSQFPRVGEVASSSTSPLQSAPSLQHGGIVPRTGTYQLHQGETVIPAERLGHQPIQEDLHAYLGLEEGGIQWAKKNPDAKKYWRLAFTPQEGRAALLEGNSAEIPVVVPRAVTNLPGRRLVAAVEAARRAQHQDPVRTLGDFLSPAVSVAPPLFDVLAKDSEDLRDPWTSHGVPGSPIRDTIVPLTPGPSYQGPHVMPQPMTPGLRESVGVGI